MRKSPNSHDDDGDDDYDPTKTACWPFAIAEIGLKHQPGNYTPEDNLNTADYGMRFVTVPTLETWTMLRKYEVYE